MKGTDQQRMAISWLDAQVFHRNAIWLPGSILEAAVTSNICSSCNPGPVYLIQFKFRQIEIPPGFNANHLGCIGGCDDTLRQLIEICGTGSRMSARGRGPTTTSSNGQRSSNRHNACIHCQQTGHSSNDCPSQFSRSRNSQSHTNSQNGDPSVSCSTCGMPCVLRTANTANNRGRKFYSCPSQECNFFIWEDGISNGNGGRSIPSTNRSASNSGRRGGRGQSGRNRSHTADTTFVSATGDPVSNRCYVCGDPSHFANVCPNRGM
ncbi:DNA topoisomerase 3-alpha [Gossypium australe]|uniref:DNA topoisomerase 3-alpha n=1 Tax=Gossypium australe TaxID=47621 RepID=A0A5B6W377_9ROSI|nr:DNA topoisomerase 3-alpha [Gossypium australe]